MLIAGHQSHDVFQSLESLGINVYCILCILKSSRVTMSSFLLSFIITCVNKKKAVRHDLHPAVFILTGGNGKWGIFQPRKSTIKGFFGLSSAVNLWQIKTVDPSI